jgi:hypothetical protein
VRAKFQRAIVAVLEESLAINAEEFFRLLDGDPTGMLSHDQGGAYRRNLHHVKSMSTDLRKILSLYLGKNKYGSN